MTKPQQWPVPSDGTQGIVCPNPDCGCAHAPVYKTVKKPHCVLRYRICRACGKHFMTCETRPGCVPESGD